mgnify:CR=1 FL=1
MTTEMMLLAIAIPIFYLTMFGESLWIHKIHPEKFKKNMGYTWIDTIASLTMGIGYLASKHIAKVITVPVYLFAYEYRIFDIPSDSWQWWVALFILQDFVFYWYHRTHHGVRILWAAHVTHHSSQHYNLSTALRQSWTAVFTTLLFYPPICLLGFDPLMLATVGLLNLFYQYWIHTEAIDKIGFLEHILMTPSHHRVHHGTQEQYLDRNHGGMFIIWDKMFGTFEPEQEQVVYGLTKNIDSYNPVVIAFHEWADIARDVKNADSLSDALGYMFKEPGWKPEPKRVKHSLDSQTLESSGL